MSFATELMTSQLAFRMSYAKKSYIVRFNNSVHLILEKEKLQHTRNRYAKWSVGFFLYVTSNCIHDYMPMYNIG